jgi:hypothetical protein
MQQQKVDKSRKLTLVLLVVLVVLSIVCSLMRLAIKSVMSVDYARITDFFVCEGPDPTTGLPREPITVVPTSMETIYACGYLETDGKASLSFLIDYKGTARGWFALNRRYQTGYVFEEIPKRSWRKPGHYLVEAWWKRVQLAAMEFQVAEDHE